MNSSREISFFLTAQKLGKHKGLIHYTIGQRKGVGISYSEPLFVVTKDMEHNRLIMGKADEVYSDSLVAGDVNFIPFDTLTEPITCTAQTRYHQKDAEMYSFTNE